MHVLFLALPLIAGGLLAVQAGANTQLSKATASPLAATMLQVIVAGLLLSIAAIAGGSVRAFADLAAAPWWHATGGLATALYVGSTILLFPRLGAIVTIGLFIAGQIFASLALDLLGLLGVPQRPIGIGTWTGALAVIGGAIAIVFGQKASASGFSAAKTGWLSLALVAGAGLPVQGAVNGLLRGDIGNPFAVGAISFAVAGLATAAIAVVTFTTAADRRPHWRGLATMPWWGWLGGVCGAFYVTTVFSVMPRIGAAATVGLTIAGQQILSVCVDRGGWFRLPRREISPLRYAGVLLLLTGVALVQFV